MFEVGDKIYECRFDTTTESIVMEWTKISRITTHYMWLEDSKYGETRMNKSVALKRFCSSKLEAHAQLQDRYIARARELGCQAFKFRTRANLVSSVRCRNLPDDPRVYYTDRLE